MARAAFIMDRVMSKAGLHGKSFIPLLSSFACAIPGIMATRAIESPKDRLVTILVAPLMSCSARLPVYTLLIATILPVASALQKAGIMLIMYMLGILGAFGVALILKKTILNSATYASFCARGSVSPMPIPLMTLRCILEAMRKLLPIGMP